MSKQYDEYIKNHKDNVVKAYEWLCSNLPELKIDYEMTICDHDLSKYDAYEYFAYDSYFYGNNRSHQVVQDFNYAWLEHIHRNPHHWQYWVLINDDPENGEIVMDIPYVYIIEMICDWWSFSWSKGDLHEIFNWYEERKDYIKLSPKTRKTVESILDKIKKKLSEEG